LDGEKLRKSFSDFTAKISKAGPDVVVVVYFAGHGLQLRGENYLLPIDAAMVSVDDARGRAVGLTDQMRALAALHPKASILILDEARVNPSSWSGAPPAGGFTWVEPEADMLVAFNAAPGTVVGAGSDSEGRYARALAEMIRGDSQTPAELFERVRLRVSELTSGAEVPWSASKIPSQFVLFARNLEALGRAHQQAFVTGIRGQPLQKIGVRDAYFVTLLRDTLDGYADFLADYWQDPMASRVQALLAARREAITWWRTYQRNVPVAYWTYLERYPTGPHTVDARSLLTRLGAATDPPSKFPRLEYDVPPPLPDELAYLRRPGLMLDDPQFAFAPPPAMPVDFAGSQPPLSAVAKSSKTLPSDDDIRRSTIGTPPLGPLAPSNGKRELEVTGTIGDPIRPSEKFISPSNFPSDVINDAGQVGAATSSPASKSPSHLPGTTKSNQTPIDQVSTTASTELRAVEALTAAVPTAELPLPNKAQGAPGGTAPSVALPLPLRRPASAPARAALSSSMRSQPNIGQSIPSTSGYASTPGSKSMVRSRSLTPAILNPLGWLTSQAATGATPSRSVKPRSTPRLRESGCTDLDGKQTCR
jgi:uncharacterized caspase-like protein